MKLSRVTLALAVAVLFSLVLSAQTEFPRMTSVDPVTTKPGAEVVAGGENLDKTHVAEVFLTDGEHDTKVEVLDQSASAIRFKVPDSMKPGRFSLMVLTATKPPRLIEQPVRLTVE